VALDRERGWLTLRRALPAPPAGYLVTKFAMAMLFAALICVILGVLGSALGGVRLPAASWALVLAVDVFGVLPFCALGLFLGTRIPAQAAPAIANLIYLPMAFLSGLLIPLPALPASLRAIAPLWPSFHAAQLALAAVGQPSIGAVWVHIAVLAAFAIVFFALARMRLVRGAQ
jgi:ABC-2 type transport system permease protein